MSDPTSSPPEEAGQRSRRRLLWWLLGGALVLAAVGAVGILSGLLAYGERNLDRVDVEGIESSDERDGEPDDDDEIDEIDEVLHVLLVGSDRREGLTAEDRERLGTGDVDGDRTDTIMLMRLDPSTEEVSVLSFPRDLLVTRCDGSRGKINAAYHIGERTDVGGPSCLVQTITEMSDLSIHHYVEVDFAGFLDVVDLVDGVTVYLEEPIRDPLAHIDLDAGCQRLSGVEALGFVRHRASDSDYGRIARQQRFVKELVREASSLRSVLNIPRLFQMVETGAGAVTTDQSLTVDKMRRIAFTLRDLDGDDLVARTIPGDYERIDGIDFEIPREGEAERLFRAFEQGRLGEEPEDDPGEEQPGRGPEERDDDSQPGSEGTEQASGEGEDGASEDSEDSGDGEGSGDGDEGDGALGAADREGAGLDAGSPDEGEGLESALGEGGEGTGDGTGDGQATPPPPSDDEQFVGAQPPPEECR